MKHLLKKDIEGATFGRIIADATSVKMKGFDFDFIKPYELVDLGIGTLWMDRNIGAASPEDAGLYFAWGETKGYTAEQCGTGEGQRAFSHDDYQFTGSPEVLPAENDAATAFDPELRMPTQAEISALWALPKKWIYAPVVDGKVGEGVEYEKGSTEGLMFDSNMNIDLSKSTKVFLGVKFVGTNSNTLFVPAAGDLFSGDAQLRGREGRLWSSSPLSGDTDFAMHGGFYCGGSSSVDFSIRCGGFPVRGVAV